MLTINVTQATCLPFPLPSPPFPGASLAPLLLPPALPPLCKSCCLYCFLRLSLLLLPHCLLPASWRCPSLPAPCLQAESHSDLLWLGSPQVLGVLCILAGEHGFGNYTPGLAPSPVTTRLWRWFSVSPLWLPKDESSVASSLEKGLRSSLWVVNFWAAMVAARACSSNLIPATDFRDGPRQAAMG